MLVAVALLSLPRTSEAAEPGCAPLEDVAFRWGRVGSFEVVEDERISDRDRGEADELFVRGRLPAALPRNPALVIEVAHALAGVSVDAEARSWEPTLPGVIPLEPGDAARVVELTFRSRARIAPRTICVDEIGPSVTRAFRYELPQFVVGAILVLFGSALLGTTLVRRRSPEYGWLGIFALPAGIISLSQSPTPTMLLGLPHALWITAANAAQFIYPIGFARFVLHVLGDTKHRLLHRGSLLLAGLLGLAVTADLLDVARMVSTRRLAFAISIVLGFVTLARAVQLRRDPAARIFVGGYSLLFLLAVHDMMWGFGFPLLHHNLAPYGLLAFAVTLLAIVEVRFATQRRELAQTSAELDQRATLLAEQQRALEDANEELRHQVETRSRELKQVLAREPQRPTGGSVPPAPGQVFGGRYVVDRELGAGAMGAVYRVHRRGDNRVFALKVATGRLTPAATARMAREAEIAAKVRHENLVSVVDVGLDEARAPFLVMEYIDGRTLAAAIPLADATLALELLGQVAEGLAVLHAHGIVHRDLKPANVLLATVKGREVAKISDFGIARVDDGEAAVSALAATAPTDRASGSLDPKLTATGMMMGTPLYMPPEAAWSAVTNAGDVFAFGVMACELLLAKYPFDVPPIMRAMANAPMEEVVLPAALGLAGPLAACLLQTLSPRPEARPTAETVAAVLRGQR